MSRGKPRKKYRVVRTDLSVVGETSNLKLPGQRMYDLLIHPIAWGVVTLILAAIAASGRMSIVLSSILLTIAFLVGCCGIARAGLGVYLTAGSCLALGVFLFLIGWWIMSRSASPSNADVMEAAPNVSIQAGDGGIAAQTVNNPTIDNNPTINNYFINQPSDEKERWRRELTKQYPLGWWLLAADGEETYTSNDLKYDRDVNIDWQGAEVSGLNANTVYLQLPHIATKDRRIIIVSGPNIRFGVSRRVGQLGDGFRFVLGQATMHVDVLKDEGSFVVLAIGVRETGNSGGEASPSK